jgi:ring-1,2-phenylacetyl-CoA epoxidase subunit PaaD
MVVWDVLETVMDPEVPALSVVDLGIVRDVEVDADGAVTVSITPTYSGCPAMHVIEEDIVAALHAGGWPNVHVRTVYAPAWSTDWIRPEGLRKLEAYGIAPPARSAVAEPLISLRRRVESVACPYCGSRETAMRSEFGPTACKALMYCRACEQPFELFKAI